MATRNIMNVPTTSEVREIDVFLYEQNNFVSAEVDTLKKRLHSELYFSKTPVTYTENNKGGTVSSRGEVYSTIYSLIMTSYGEIHREAFLNLAIFNVQEKTVKFGVATIQNIDDTETVVLEASDESALQFEENDVTPCNIIIISPYGEIPGTETWTII